jgi:hypothetical protein
MRMDLFLRLDSWLSAAIFSALMIVAWWLGDRRRLMGNPAIHGGATQKPSTRIEDASLALFGLLLAFCFAGAVSRYEARKQVLLDDAMAIAGLATVNSLLEEPDRSAIDREIRAYVDQRLVFGITPLDAPQMEGLLRDARAAQGRMTSLVSAAITRKNTPSVHPSLVDALNGVMEAADRRLYRVRAHVPGSIVLMLVLFGVFAAYTMGRLQDAPRGEAGGPARLMAYAVLVGLVFFVTIDLEQPRRGLLRVSQAPMEDLRSSLAAPTSQP